MTRAKKNTGTKTRHSAGIGEGSAVGTALLVIDQTPFLKKALSTCRRLRKELHTKQALLAEMVEGMAEYLECLYEEACYLLRVENAPAAAANAGAARAETTNGNAAAEKNRRPQATNTEDARQMSFF